MNLTVQAFVDPNIGVTYFSLYKMMFALVDADHVDDSRLPGLGVVMFIAFTILILVLLFTTLIAAVVDSYRTTRKLFDENWVRKTFIGGS